MKHILFLILLFCSTFLIAQDNYEQQTESWIDSTFLANDINWENTKAEFLLFAQDNFKNTLSISEFLVRLHESTSPKNEEKGAELKTSGYKTLVDFAELSSDFLKPLENDIRQQIWANNEMCRMMSITKLYLFIYDLNYWSPERFSLNHLAQKLRVIDQEIESVNLRNKISLIVLLQKIYSQQVLIGRESFAYQECNKIEIIKVDQKSYEQHDTTDDSDETEYSDIEPCFIGGPQGMIKFISAFFVYPELAKELDIQGLVYVSFIVNADGSISDVGILNSPDDILSKEAIRIVQAMPNWLPGNQAGKAVRVRYTVPINFKLA